MKIKTTSGTVIDTKDLNDKEAEISKQINRLYEVCKFYDVTMVAKVIVNENKMIGAQNQSEGPKKNETMIALLNALNFFVNDVSGGQLRIVQNGGGPVNEDNPFD